ncbi:breast cancer type 1 susceptibility protein isoform X1 [Arapaima gigas]
MLFEKKYSYFRCLYEHVTLETGSLSPRRGRVCVTCRAVAGKVNGGTEWRASGSFGWSPEWKTESDSEFLCRSWCEKSSQMFPVDEDMQGPKVEDVKRSICVIWENLQCPICLDLMTSPISTKCDHQFCRCCITKLLDSNKKREANCPICKAKVTKRSLQESPGFERLVEGLKNIVQAFEEDTCSNCESVYLHYLNCTLYEAFTEKLQKAGPENPVCEGETSSNDKHHTGTSDNSQSRRAGDATVSAPSSVEAKNGFARLMGLEDSGTFVSEEDLPTGTSCLPQTSEELGNNCTANIVCPNRGILGVESGKLIPVEGKKSCQKMGMKAVLHIQGSQELGTTDNNTGKEIYNEETQIGSKKEEILDIRQKKSLEKVSEWLLSISPNDSDKGDPNLGIFPNDSDDYTSGGGSSSSTAKGDEDEGQSRIAKPVHHGLRLEEKVFGVTYKRERRTTRAQINSVPSKTTASAEVFTCGPAEKVQSKKAKEKRINKLTPADFIKKPYTNLEEHSPIKDQSETGKEPCAFKGQSVDAGGEVGVDERSEPGTDGRTLEPMTLLEEEGNVKDGSVGEGNSLQSGRQEFSDNLIQKGTEVENGKKNGKLKKKRNQRQMKPNRSAKKKLFQKSKALDFICGGLGESDSALSPTKRPSSELQIESFPSSDDKGSPLLNGFRRSRRRQLFTEDVQGSSKKDQQLHSVKTAVPDSKNEHMQCSAEYKEDKMAVVSSGGGRKNAMERTVVRNGCIASEDMIEIVNDDIGVNIYVEEQSEKQPGTSEEASRLSYVPNTETLQASPQCSLVKGVHPGSPVWGKVLSEGNFEVPLPVGNGANEAIGTEVGDLRNDSELDTELLLRTFKSTKRKSFHIGSPNSKRSNRSSFASDKHDKGKEQNNGDKGKEVEPEPLYLQDSVELVQQETETFPLEVINHSASEEVKNDSYYSRNLSTDPPIRAACEAAAEKSCRSRKTQDAVCSRATSKPLQTEQLLHSGASRNCNVDPCVSSGSSNKADGDLPRIRNGQSSRYSRHNEHVDSELLFPTCTASGEEQWDPTSHITENLHLGSSVTNADPAEASESSNREHGACTGQQFGEPPSCRTGNLLESSMTSDGLLPPNVVVVASTSSISSSGPNLTAGSGEGTVGSFAQVNFVPKKRKRPRRLESSESECSSDDQLPSFVEMLGHSKPHPADVDKEVLFKPQNDPTRNQWSPGKLPPGEDSRRPNPPPSSVSEWVPASQMSVDLFGTPEKCEGDPCDTGLSGECSQFSTEIIATQQKLAMQEELRKLEKMMALVTEALHRKGDGPQPVAAAVAATASPAPQSTDPAGAAALFCTPRRSPPPALALVSSVGRRSRECRDGTISLPGPAARDANQDEGTHTTAGRCSSTRGRGRKNGKATEESKNNLTTMMLDRKRTSVQSCTVGTPPGVMPVGLNLKLPAPLDTGSVAKDTQRHTQTRHGQMILVASGLNTAELLMVKKFAKKTGGSMCMQMTPETTHVVIRTDEELVCERTLKYFLGIAGRKWVVSFHWIAESFKQGKVLDEARFEVQGDVATGRSHRGPAKARNTDDQKLLMKGYEICFQGSCSDMTTDQMEWMAELCGAKVVKDPLLFTSKRKSRRQLVVAQPGPDGLQTDYKALQKRATVVSRGWLLDTVATYTLQNPDGYAF